MSPTLYQNAYGGKFAGGDIATHGAAADDPRLQGLRRLRPEGQPRRQISKAKDALKKCGQPNGFTTTIGYRSSRDKEKKVAEAFQQSLGKVGIKINIKPMPDDTYTSELCGKPSYLVAQQGRPLRLRLGCGLEHRLRLPGRRSSTAGHQPRGRFAELHRAGAQILSDAQAINKLGHGVSGFTFAGDCQGCLGFTVQPGIWADGTHLTSGDIGNQTANITGNTPLVNALTLYRQLWTQHLVAGQRPHRQRHHLGPGLRGREDRHHARRLRAARQPGQAEPARSRVHGHPAARQPRRLQHLRRRRRLRHPGRGQERVGRLGVHPVGAADASSRTSTRPWARRRSAPTCSPRRSPPRTPRTRWR